MLFALLDVCVSYVFQIRIPSRLQQMHIPRSRIYALATTDYSSALLSLLE